MIKRFNTYNKSEVFLESSNYKYNILKRNLSNGKYTCINFGLNNKEEAEIVEEYLKQFGFISNIQDVCYTFHNNELQCKTIFTIDSPAFTKFHVYGSGHGEHMEDDSFSKTYPEYTISPIFSVKELISYINRYMSPSYAPRKIDRTLENLNESTYYTDNKTLLEEETHLPKYMIGDSVRFRPDPETIQKVSSVQVWGLNNKQLRFTEENKGKELKIIEKYTTGPDMDEEKLSNRWWSAFECIYNSGKIWFLDDTIEPFEKIPSYTPRRIDRTLEAVSGYKYELIKFFPKNNMELTDIITVFYNDFGIVGESGMNLPNMINRIKDKMDDKYHSRLLVIDLLYKDFHTIEKEYLTSHNTNISSWVKDMNNDKITDPNNYKYEHLKRMVNMLRSRQWDTLYNLSRPSYEPRRRMDRTLESVNNRAYDKMVFVIRSKEENIMVQNLLFNNNFYWLNHSGVKSFTCYPQLIWVYFKTSTLSSSTYSPGDYTDQRVHDFIASQNKSGEKVNPILFQADDVKHFNSIKKYGIKGPTYEPKKINRDDV